MDPSLGDYQPVKPLFFHPSHLEKEVLQSNLRTVRLPNKYVHTHTHVQMKREVVPFPFQQKKSKSKRSDLSFVNSHPPKCFSRCHIPRWSKGKKNTTTRTNIHHSGCDADFFFFFLSLFMAASLIWQIRHNQAAEAERNSASTSLFHFSSLMLKRDKGTGFWCSFMLQPEV